MRDELDGRMWADHHDQFNLWVKDATDAVRGALARLGSWDGTTHRCWRWSPPSR